MTKVTITLPAAGSLHALEIWSNTMAVTERFMAEMGFGLPRLGTSGGTDALRLIRVEPCVWLVEGDPTALTTILGGDGTITAIGGGIVRIRLSGSGWRSLLMEGGMFDAESSAFAPGCIAATLIDHVAVRLHVISADACDVYVPASFSAGLLHFWRQALETLTE